MKESLENAINSVDGKSNKSNRSKKSNLSKKSNKSSSKKSPTPIHKKQKLKKSQDRIIREAVTYNHFKNKHEITKLGYSNVKDLKGFFYASPYSFFNEILV
jgi:hypothetical protein